MGTKQKIIMYNLLEARLQIELGLLNSSYYFHLKYLPLYDYDTFKTEPFDSI